MTAEAPTEDALRAALAQVRDPESGRDLIAAGLLDGIELRGGIVQAALRTTREGAPRMEAARRAAERALASVPGVTSATVTLTAHRAAPEVRSPSATAGPATAAAAKAAPATGTPDPRQRPRLLADIGTVIAVASGKGGVGKSTVAVNLAIALARAGRSVGLLDADIYGPSLPRLLGLSGKPEVRGDRMVPANAWGMLAMSIGLIAGEDTPMIWRGPMIMQALEQMVTQVAWGQLDAMVIDLPPGTGDVQLTMAQRMAVTGAIIVSTPQDLALIDARRGAAMFERVNIPVLGMVENMSYFCCPKCGHRTELFGHGGARREAARLGVPFLGEVPLLADIRAASDDGRPVTAAAPDSAAAHAFMAVAEATLAALEGRRA